MSTTYEYMDEAPVDLELICSICHSPFKDPCCTPCGETFCCECITRWIQTQDASCPICRKDLSVDVLTQPARLVRNLLDQILVKCIACGQANLWRGNFDDHIQKVCPKTFVSCSSADIKCSWRGQRDQLNQHSLDCRFEAIRPLISEFIVEYQQLKDQVNQQVTQINEQQDKIGQLNEQQNKIGQLEEQLREKDTEIVCLSRELRE